MDKLSITSAIIFSLSSVAAHAADLAMPVMADNPAPAAASQAEFSWTGPYIGAAVGYGFGKLSQTFVGNSEEFEFDAESGGSSEDRTKGFLGGVYAGYSHQLGNIIIGGEADVQYSDVGASHTTDESHAEYKARWLGTARARLGYSLGRLLPYVTAGGAVGRFELDGVADTDTRVKLRDTKAGYTLGAGLDYAITDNLIGRVEYQYLDFETVNYLIDAELDVDENIHTVRVGLAFKF